MPIKNNIRETIDRLDHYKAGLELAVRRAIAPERWFAELKTVAQDALSIEASTDPDAAWAVPKFLALMGAAFFGNRSEWWMSGPDPGAAQDAIGGVAEAIKRVQGVRSQMDEMPTRFPQGGGFEMELVPVNGGGAMQASPPDLLDRMTLEQAMEMIREWVEAGAQGIEGGKIFEEARGDQAAHEKQGQYDNELVERLWHIFGIHPADMGRDYIEIDGPQAEAIGGLTRHIVDFFAGKGGGRSISAETVDLWLRRVLAAWTARITMALPGAIDEELKKEWVGKGD